MDRWNWLKARTIFYPTLAWNMLLSRVFKVRRWYDEIAPHVIIGAYPFAADIAGLYAAGVRAVVNTCEEYAGPIEEYELLKIEQFHMPTIDFTHPLYDDVIRAVAFVDRHVESGNTVYIHCKAGRGRSATVAICWLMKNQQISAAEAQKWINSKRPHVNQRLATRPVVQRFEQTFVKPKSDE